MTTSSLLDPPVTAAGKWNPAEHPRDSEGKFAEKPGGGGGGGSLKITHALVHKKHPTGTIVAQTPDGEKRVVWSGSNYHLQRKSGSKWETDEVVKKSKAYKAINEYADDWVAPKKHEDFDESKPEPPKPKTTSQAKPKPKSKDEDSTPVTSSDLSGTKITEDMLAGDFPPFTVVAKNEKGDTVLQWTGNEYAIRTKAQHGTWATIATYNKSEMADLLDDLNDTIEHGGTWNILATPTSMPASPKPVPASKPTPAPIPPSTLGKTGTMIGLSKIGDQKGSVPGGTYVDVKDAKTYYVKAPKSETHVQNELLANALYKSAGVKVPELEAVALGDEFGPDKNVGVKSKIVNGKQDLSLQVVDPAYQKKLHENFAVDAWLANWDVAGAGYDNVITDENGDPVRVDAGGALLFRAQGAVKGSKFTDTVDEIDSLRNAMINPQAAVIFKDVTDADIRKGVAKIEKITPEQIDAMVDAAGFKGGAAANLKKKLKSRRQDLIDRFGTEASQGEPKETIEIVQSIFLKDYDNGAVVVKSVSGDQRVTWAGNEYAYQVYKADGKWHTAKTWPKTGAGIVSGKHFLLAHGDIWVAGDDENIGTNAYLSPGAPMPAMPTIPDVPKTYHPVQIGKVTNVFKKNNVKWYNDTKAIYDSALEVSKMYPDLSMGDALDIMDQSLKKKTGNPFRTKVEKFLKTKAGKNYAMTKGGPAGVGTTQPGTVMPSSHIPSTTIGAKIPQKLTPTHANTLQAEMDKAYPPPWTPQQRSSISSYTGSAYVDINKCLRKTAPCTTTRKKQAQHIKDAMKPSVADVVLYRKTEPKSFGLGNVDSMNDLVGKTISDDGVISTSIYDGNWSGSIHLEIEAPKGTKMAWAKPISKYPHENEMILAPGTKFQVVSVSQHPIYPSQRVVKVRAIPGSEAA